MLSFIHLINQSFLHQQRSMLLIDLSTYLARALSFNRLNCVADIDSPKASFLSLWYSCHMACGRHRKRGGGWMISDYGLTALMMSTESLSKQQQLLHKHTWHAATSPTTVLTLISMGSNFLTKGTFIISVNFLGAG